MGTMKAILFIFGYSVLVTTVMTAFNNKFSGPFDIVIKQMADCEHPEQYPAKWFGNKITRLNRTTFKYSGMLMFPMDIDESIQVKATLAIFGNGGWRENYFVVDLGSACGIWQRYAPQVVKKMDQALATCPVPAGNYTLNDVPLSIDFKWPSMVYSSYRMDLRYLKNGNKYLCKRVFMDIVPKQKKP